MLAPHEQVCDSLAVLQSLRYTLHRRILYVLRSLPPVVSLTLDWRMMREVHRAGTLCMPFMTLFHLLTWCH